MINNMIVCICKNDNYIAYNNRLVRCNLEIDPKDLNIIEKNKKVRYIECEKMVICIRKNEILIDYREKSFVELINVKNVRKCTCWGDHLFLMMKKNSSHQIFLININLCVKRIKTKKNMDLSKKRNLNSFYISNYILIFFE